MYEVKNQAQISALRACGRINAAVHRAMRQSLHAGVTGQWLDAVARDVLASHGAIASFEREYGFPGAICVSINDEVGHGVPDDRVIRDGDIVKLDVGAFYNDMHTDAAATYVVGAGSSEAHALVTATRQAMYAGVAAAVAGARASAISHAVYKSVRQTGYDTIRSAFGHGIGSAIHEDPQIANFGPSGYGPRLRPGMVICIEPIVTVGARFTYKKPNDWTTATIDGASTAHFEHTVHITATGVEVLTEDADDTASRAVGSLDVPNSTSDVEGLGVVSIRQRQPGDDSILLEMAHRAMDPVLMEAWGRRVQAHEVSGGEGVRTLVLDAANGPIGFITFTMKGIIHVNTLVISPEYQHLGIGRMAMREIERVAQLHHAPAIELWVQTNNKKALRFYDKLGFVVTGRPYFNTLSMKKPLTTK